MSLTVGSLFSGIGGLDLGLERAGMRVIWQSEIDPYACKVLGKHWPEVVNHGNIKEINWDEIKRPDVICGGYPCQPFSTAGKRRGEEDPRHLWPWVREAISRLRPRYAILENVRGHLSLGGLSVIGELATIGYDAEWQIVSAASQGAPHLRERVIIVAYPNNARPHRTEINTAETGQSAFAGFGRCGANVANSSSLCSYGGQPRKHTTQSGEQGLQAQVGTSGDIGGALPNDERKRNGQLGFSTDASVFGGCWATDRDREAWNERREWWTAEPDVGRVANGVPNRVDRLRGLGNAVVPQVAQFIGELVISHADAIDKIDTPT